MRRLPGWILIEVVLALIIASLLAQTLGQLLIAAARVHIRADPAAEIVDEGTGSQREER